LKLQSQSNKNLLNVKTLGCGSKTHPDDIQKIHGDWPTTVIE
jgi:hypothetical protein